MVSHLDQDGVAARDDQGHDRKDRVDTLAVGWIVEPGRVHVALQVIDADQGEVVDPGQRLGEVDPYEKRASQAGPIRDGDGIDLRPAHARIGPRLVEGGHDPAKMGARGDLGHDPARRGM